MLASYFQRRVSLCKLQEELRMSFIFLRSRSRLHVCDKVWVGVGGASLFPIPAANRNFTDRVEAACVLRCHDNPNLRVTPSAQRGSGGWLACTTWEKTKTVEAKKLPWDTLLHISLLSTVFYRRAHRVNVFKLLIDVTHAVRCLYLQL